MNTTHTFDDGKSEAKERQYYLDWIRTFTILIVFLFHDGRFFDSDDWHIKNAVKSPAADFILFLLKEWLMPIFFFVSGASTWFSISYKKTSKFAADRFKRIFIPLLFGIFILSPPQVYVERLSHGQFSGSFWLFLPHYFSGWYGFGGNFAWMGLHLWYLLLLFVFSFLTLPLFIWWKNNRNSSTIDAPLICFFVFVLILASVGILISLDNFLMNRSFAGWGILEHLIIFICGFYAYAKPGIQPGLIRQRYIFLLITLLATAINSFLYLNHMLYEYGTLDYGLKIVLRSLACFGWIFTIFGFAEKHLNYTNRFLKYSNEAVLPFYILHQPIMLLTGYFIINTAMSLSFKYLLIAIISFALVMICYQFIIRKNNWLRYLFGMPKAKQVKDA
ncbi:Peptidoglycan/LPS O-acetylase OafA/YrhL, contains acyltransferase and SGNH-hydrolase domains [Chitinophaga costaii]|uniref:Peptidoglycan/LPS O-acetylase OafA/YrhL, contains acyltransferase and SGNH-hydrolase domains n=1 Tax=Chitinophaga costaii TaxID=1335309 RepID=A0A1C4BC76_9BACT|nr:acyltransferase family protein [Chitinophaga costaii]PUZ27664.1 hypothetical protein DCM91_05460 [Chitinophaga costaii]SCC04551.1 Peptidoglycan/LPS O-acetylase OafA/YrhL, contains acyltransferase and SGNH-hydrolase domains [Chitinophaga costaii]